MTRTEALNALDSIAVKTMRHNARLLKTRGATMDEIGAEMRRVAEWHESTRHELAVGIAEFFGTDVDEMPDEAEIIVR